MIDVRREATSRPRMRAAGQSSARIGAYFADWHAIVTAEPNSAGAVQATPARRRERVMPPSVGA
jgi:hypothetical protein